MKPAQYQVMEQATKAGARQVYMPVTLLDEPVQEPVVRAYGITELAKLYGICRQTMTKWLLPFMPELVSRGHELGARKLNPACVRLIFERLGEP